MTKCPEECGKKEEKEKEKLVKLKEEAKKLVLLRFHK